MNRPSFGGCAAPPTAAKRFGVCRHRSSLPSRTIRSGPRARRGVAAPGRSNFHLLEYAMPVMEKPSSARALGIAHQRVHLFASRRDSPTGPLYVPASPAISSVPLSALKESIPKISPVAETAGRSLARWPWARCRSGRYGDCRLSRNRPSSAKIGAPLRMCRARLIVSRHQPVSGRHSLGHARGVRMFDRHIVDEDRQGRVPWSRL